MVLSQVIQMGLQIRSCKQTALKFRLKFLTYFITILPDFRFLLIVLYDGGNIDKEQWLRFPTKPNEAKLNIMRRRLILDNLDPIIYYIIPVMCHNLSVLY